METLAFEHQQAWETWLAEHHASSPGVWIQLAKKGSGIPSVTRDEALDVALCFGWIDGQARSRNEAWWLQKFTPRRARSIWSKVNREKVRVLTESGRMQPAGLAAVQSAKQDGRWDAAYDSPSSATVPADLQEALDSNPEAAACFATLNKSNRYAILFQIQTARRAETRARRIAKFIDMLTRRELLHP